MKVILINDCYRYIYPDNCTSLEDFIELLEQSKRSFIPLRMLLIENCVHPYYIKEENKTFYVNILSISNVTEEDIFLLSKEEYENKLAEVISEVCVDCANYEEDQTTDNLKGHREKICLDGTCCWFSKNEF